MTSDASFLVDAGGGIEVATRVRGSGPPLLLLHGYPQTQRIWTRVADELAGSYTVVTTDLRGYGGSSKPRGTPDHATYSKRAMANDQVEVMRYLGFTEFAVAGHDRGGRVVHRLCLDHPSAVTRAAVLDILPTAEVFASTDRQLATAYFHWFFLTQPSELAETLINRAPDAWIDHMLALAGGSASIDDADIRHYRELFRNPAAVHASCEDYRAAASIDLEHDSADAARSIECPLLVLWGERGLLAHRENPLVVWRRHARQARGSALPGGHYLVDDCPAEVARELATFLSPDGDRAD